MLDFMWPDITLFLQNPTHVFIVATSLVLAVLILLASSIATLDVKKRAMLLYAHVFFLVFPIIYFLFSVTCKYMFAHCGREEFIFYITTLSAITALLTGLVFAPVIFIRWYKRQAREINDTTNPLVAFIVKHSKKMGIYEVKLYVCDSAKPLAFSYSFLKSKIFISIGMIDILTKKELESVLLHELYHIKHKSGMLKHALHLLRATSPIAAFTVSAIKLDHEERSADAFAISQQETDRFICRAKAKVEDFNRAQCLL
ncbi:M48 family metalloprotease [Candidatus Woesearchaeota archaeon]|nr:M48 family metalloprotease [Candidatus Woesearchaeota archaeon]